MGLFDLIDAFQRVSTTPVAGGEAGNLEYMTEVDPNNPAVRRMRPGREGIGAKLTDVMRASDGRLTSVEAANFGMPQAEGMSRQDLQMMLRMQDRDLNKRKTESEIDENKARTNYQYRRTAGGGSGEDLDLKLLELANTNVNKRLQEDPLYFGKIKTEEDKANEVNAEFRTLAAAYRNKGKQAPKKKDAAPKADGAMIRVKRKSDGREGMMPAAKFNDKVYEKL